MSFFPQLTGFFKAALRRVVPESLRKERGIVIRLGPGAGGTYARLRLLDSLSMTRMKERTVPSSARSYLFVCFGNIMRSPMADALLKKAAADGQIDIVSDSAGVHAIPGNQAHPWAQTAASEIGISLAAHRAKLLSAEMVEQADAVFAMDLQNLAELLNSFPSSKNKLFMLSAYAGRSQRLREIPDPYFGDLEVTRQCYRLLETCIRNLVASRPVAGVLRHEPKMARDH